MAVSPSGLMMVFLCIDKCNNLEVAVNLWLSGLCEAGLVERLDLHVAEFDPPSLGLEADVALLDLAVVPLVGHRSIDPEGHVLTPAGDFKGIPLTGGLDA